MSGLQQIDAESQAVTTSIGISSFTPMPTNAGVINREFEQHLSLQAVDDLKANDVLEFRIPPLSVGSGQCYVPAESYLETSFIIRKQTAVDMQTLQDELSKIAPNLGWPSTGLFKRSEVTYNNTPVTATFDHMQQAELITQLVNRPRSDLDSEGITGGWSFDRYMSGGSKVLGAVFALAGGGTVGADGQIALTTAGLINSAGMGGGIVNAGNTAYLKQPELHSGTLCYMRAVSQGAGAGVGTTAAFNTAYGTKLFELTAIAPQAANLNQSQQEYQLTFKLVASSATTATTNAGAAAARIGTTVVAPFDLQQGGVLPAAAAAGATNTLSVEIMFMSRAQDDARALSKPGYLLPLGQNKGALERSRYWLQGSNSGTATDGYVEFSCKYRFPTVGAFSQCSYLPDGTQIGIKLVLNDLERQFRDYSRNFNAAGGDTAMGNASRGVALSNIDIKFRSARMMMHKVTLSPSVDSAIQAQFASGDVVRLPCIQTKSYVQRFDGGVNQMVLRSVLGSNGRPARMFIYSALDSAMSGTVPRGASSQDLVWDAPRYRPIGAATGTLLPAAAIDIQQLYVSVNGQSYPARRLEQNVSHATAVQTNLIEDGSQDYAEAIELYKHTCALPYDCALKDYDWKSIKVYAIDFMLQDSLSIADPVQTNVNIDVFITLSDTTPNDAARVIGLVAQYQSQITCDQSRTFVNDLQ